MWNYIELSLTTQIYIIISTKKSFPVSGNKTFPYWQFLKFRKKNQQFERDKNYNSLMFDIARTSILLLWHFIIRGIHLEHFLKCLGLALALEPTSGGYSIRFLGVLANSVVRTTNTKTTVFVLVVHAVRFKLSHPICIPSP